MRGRGTGDTPDGRGLRLVRCWSTPGILAVEDVSARVDLPDPDRPVNATNLLFGISRLM